MRLYVFIILFFLSGSLSAQSYFNKRYPADNGWGGVVTSIVVRNDSLVFNIFSVNNTTSSLQDAFTKISTSNGGRKSGSNLVKDSTDYYAAKITSCADGGFVDVMTIVEYGELFTYGVIKYKPNGDTIFFNTSIDSVLYIYI